MIPVIPFKFSNNETLSPKKLVANFQEISKQITKLQGKRYTYSSFVLTFDGITSADDVALRTFRIRAPLAYEVVGVEIQYYDNAASTVTLTSTASGFQTVTLTSSGSLTERAYIYKVQNCIVGSLTDTDFILAVSAGTVETCKVIVHIRSSRFSAEPANYTLSDVMAIPSGGTTSAANLNTEFSEVAAAVTADSASQQDLRIQVITRRNVVTPFPTTDTPIFLPSSGRSIHSMDATIVAVATNNVSATLRDETGGSVVSVSTVANGATTIVRTTASVNDTQSVDDPDDSADDYLITMSRTGAGVATIPLFYTVIYYT